MPDDLPIVDPVSGLPFVDPDTGLPFVGGDCPPWELLNCSDSSSSGIGLRDADNADGAVTGDVVLYSGTCYTLGCRKCGLTPTSGAASKQTGCDAEACGGLLALNPCCGGAATGGLDPTGTFHTGDVVFDGTDCFTVGTSASGLTPIDPDTLTLEDGCDADDCPDCPSCICIDPGLHLTSLAIALAGGTFTKCCGGSIGFSGTFPAINTILRGSACGWCMQSSAYESQAPCGSNLQDKVLAGTFTHTDYSGPACTTATGSTVHTTANFSVSLTIDSTDPKECRWALGSFVYDPFGPAGSECTYLRVEYKPFAGGDPRGAYSGGSVIS